MKLYYSPVVSKITEYADDFLYFMQETFPSYLEEEDYKSFVNTNKNVVFTKEHFFVELNNTIYVYSGFLRIIIKNFRFDLVSTVEKYTCSNKELNSILYEHQNKVVKAAIRNNRGIIKSPTGSGKSFIIGDLVSRYIEDGQTILITVPTIDLLKQLSEDINTCRELSGLEPLDIGAVGNGELSIKQVTIGIPNSLSKLNKVLDKKTKMKDYLETVDVLIADEVHTCATPTYSLIIDHMLNMKVSLGLSATPWTNGANHNLLYAFFGDLIIEVFESEMIKKNIIMEPLFEYYTAPKAFLSPHLSKSANQISTISNKYRYKVLNQVYEQLISNNKGRNNLIVKLGIERLEQDIGPIVIICNKIRGENCHGKILQEMFLSEGYNLPIIGGHVSKKKREKLIDDLKSSNILGVIAGPKVLSAGISIPSLSTIILAGAGKSDSEYIQRVGRLLRKDEGKERPKVIDFIDQQYWFNKQSRSRIDVAENVYGSLNIKYK